MSTPFSRPSERVKEQQKQIKTNLNLLVPEAFKKKLKTHCASQGIAMSQLVVDVLTASLGMYEK